MSAYLLQQQSKMALTVGREQTQMDSKHGKDRFGQRRLWAGLILGPLN